MLSLDYHERYCIIYVWKIIEGLVPKFSNPIVCSVSIVHRTILWYYAEGGDANFKEYLIEIQPMTELPRKQDSS